MKQKGPGRPSKLTDAQKSEIGRRLAQGGEGNTVTELAREFRVSKSVISSSFSKRAEKVKSLARQLATTESEIETMSFSEQVSIRSLADQLKGISDNLARAAHANARVSAKAAEKAAAVMETASEPEELQHAGALVVLANKAGELGMGLLAANKAASSGTSTLEDLVTGGGK